MTAVPNGPSLLGDAVLFVPCECIPRNLFSFLDAALIPS